MKLTIPVTDLHISKGDRKQEDSCPIALAALAAAEIAGLHVTTALVNSESIGLYNEEGIVMKALTPEEAAKFIGDFDEGMPVEPFTLEIEGEAASSMKRFQFPG